MSERDSDESDEDLQEIWNVFIMRRKKTIRTRPNYFVDYDDIEFRSRFRVNKDTARHVLNLIRPHIEKKTHW